MSLVRVEPKKVLSSFLDPNFFGIAYLLQYTGTSSVDSRSPFGMEPRRNHGHFILFYIFASGTRNAKRTSAGSFEVIGLID